MWFFLLTQFFFFCIFFLRPVLAQGNKGVAKRGRFWVGFPLEVMKYLIFSLLRSGVEVKRGVEFCTQYLQIQNSAESGKRSVSILGSLHLPRYMRDTIRSYKTDNNNNFNDFYVKHFI